MAATQAKRGVLVEVDTKLAPGYDKPLQELERRIAALQNNARNIAVNVGTIGPAAVAARNGTTPQPSAGRRRGVNSVTGFAGGAGPGNEWDTRQTDKAIADIAKFQRAADEAQRKDDERAKKAAEIQKRKDAADVLKKAQEAGKARGKLEETVVKREEKHQANQEKERQRAIRETTTASERAAASQREAFARVTSSINGSLDATMQLARGFVLLGSVNEKDTQKIMRNLMEVQGVIDTVRGGIDSVRGIHSTVSSMRAAGQAASAARGIGGVAGAVGTAGNVAGAARGIGGLLGAGGGMAGMMGSAAAVAAPVAAFAAAAASIGVAGKVIYESLTGSAKNVNSWSMTIATAEVKIAEKLHIVNLGGAKTDRMQEKLDKSRKARAEQDERSGAEFRRQGADRENYLDMKSRRNALAAYQRPIDHLTPGGRVDVTADRKQMLAVQANSLAADRADVERMLAEARAGLASVTRGGERGPGFKDAAGNVEAMERRSMELREKELQLARQQRDVDIDGAKQRLQLLTNQLGTQKQIHAAAVGQKRSFAARFGQLNPMQQQAVISAKQRVMQGRGTQQDLDLVDQHADEQGRMAAEAQRAKMGTARLSAPDARAAGMGVMEEQGERNARKLKNRAREELGGEQAELERSLNIKARTTVDNQIAVTIAPSDDLENLLAEKFDESMEIFMRNQNERIEAWVKRSDSAAQSAVDNAIRRQNQQGRILAR